MESTNVWLLAGFIVWLGCVVSLYIHAIQKGWVEPGIFQSLSNLQLYRLAKAAWISTLLFVVLSAVAFIYLETDLVFKGFPPARFELTSAEYEKKLRDRHKEIVLDLDLFKDRTPVVMLSEKEDIEERLAEVDLDYSGYNTWIRSQIYQLEALKESAPANLLIEARKALAADSPVEADLYLEQIERNLQTRPETAARIAYMRGRLAKWKVDYEKSYEHTVRAAYLLADNAGFYKEAGLMAYNTGNYEKALDYYQASLELDTRAFGEYHPQIARNHYSLGAVWWRLENYRKALEHYEHALNVNVKHHGQKHPSVADNHYDVGLTLIMLKEYQRAISHFDRALSIDQPAHVQDSPRVIRHYEKLGEMWGELKDYRKAIQYYEKALAASLKRYGENHVEVADQQSRLGWTWANLRQYSMSKIYYKYALDNYLKNHEETHPDVIRTRNNLKAIDGAIRSGRIAPN